MTAPDLARCPSCQAPHGPGEAFCWMCRERLWDNKAAQPAAPVKEAPAPAPNPPAAPKAGPESAADFVRRTSVPKPRRPRPRSEFLDRWTQPILVAAFLFVLIGLAMGSANGTALMWIAMIPGLFVAALAGFQEPQKEPETFLEKAQLITTKLASVLAIVIIAAGALFLALLAACAAILGGFGH